MTQLALGDHRLRPWREADAEALAKNADDPRIAAHLRDLFPSPYRLEHARTYLAAIAPVRPATSFALATAEDEPIGGISLKVGQDVHRRTAELGYWLTPAHWGRGLMTAAVRAITTYAFGELDLLRVHADVFHPHRASERVLEKADYHLEGIQRASAVKGGRIVDQAVYVRLREDAVGDPRGVPEPEGAGPPPQSNSST